MLHEAYLNEIGCSSAVGIAIDVSIFNTSAQGGSKDNQLRSYGVCCDADVCLDGHWIYFVWSLAMSVCFLCVLEGEVYVTKKAREANGSRGIFAASAAERDAIVFNSALSAANFLVHVQLARSSKSKAAASATVGNVRSKKRILN
jgi:hypothetical protein